MTPERIFQSQMRLLSSSLITVKFNVPWQAWANELAAGYWTWLVFLISKPNIFYGFDLVPARAQVSSLHPATELALIALAGYTPRTKWDARLSLQLGYGYKNPLLWSDLHRWFEQPWLRLKEDHGCLSPSGLARVVPEAWSLLCSFSAAPVWVSLYLFHATSDLLVEGGLNWLAFQGQRILLCWCWHPQL